ncbi:MAG TPA: hypothetical protein V6C88_03445 [Chroococcidiopsis sp.]
MPTYEEVFKLVQCLSLTDQARLREALSLNLSHSAAVEDTKEVISAAELTESAAALQDYWDGRDPGITPEALKHRISLML